MCFFLLLYRTKSMLQTLFLCQFCVWGVLTAPSLSKMEGVITPDQSIQSLTNTGGNSLYTGIGNASPSARSTGDALLTESKVGVADAKGIGGEDFAVTNTITSSKDSGAKTFDQTSPAFNEVQPTAKVMKSKKAKGKKQTKGKNKTQKTKTVASENSLVDKFTTTPMPPVFQTMEPFAGMGDFFTTTQAFGFDNFFTPQFTTPLPLQPEQNNPPTTTFTRKLLFSSFCFNSFVKKKVKFSVTLFCKSTSKYWYFYLPSISACSANIRANPLNRNEYHYLSGAFSGYYIKCPAGLQFREDRCRCDWPIMEAVENCSCCKSGVMKHETHRNMFKRLINGVWVDDSCVSQSMVFDDKECKCVWNANKAGKEIFPVDKPSKSFLRCKFSKQYFLWFLERRGVT